MGLFLDVKTGLGPRTSWTWCLFWGPVVTGPLERPVCPMSRLSSPRRQRTRGCVSFVRAHFCLPSCRTPRGQLSPVRGRGTPGTEKETETRGHRASPGVTAPLSPGDERSRGCTEQPQDHRDTGHRHARGCQAPGRVLSNDRTSVPTGPQTPSDGVPAAVRVPVSLLTSLCRWPVLPGKLPGDPG